jgi:uncharacterized membrane protein
MENKTVGYLLLLISFVIIGIIFLFNRALKEIVNASCTMAGHDQCVMYETITQQTYLSLIIVGILFVVSIILIYAKQSEKIIIRKVKEFKPKKNWNISDLKDEEKTVLNIIKEGKSVFQADLIDQTGLGKAKMTRIIDRLEGKGFVERRRRGMTNIVVLKD